MSMPVTKSECLEMIRAILFVKNSNVIDHAFANRIIAYYDNMWQQLQGE